MNWKHVAAKVAEHGATILGIGTVVVVIGGPAVDTYILNVIAAEKYAKEISINLQTDQIRQQIIEQNTQSKTRDEEQQLQLRELREESAETRKNVIDMKTGVTVLQQRTDRIDKQLDRVEGKQDALGDKFDQLKNLLISPRNQ